MATVNNETQRGKQKETESTVKSASVTMATGQSERKINSAESFDKTRTEFLNNPGVPVSTGNEQVRLQKEKKNEKSKRKKSCKRRERVESLDPYETEDKETRRLRELQERHMSVLEDLTKLRNHYYTVYMSKLTDKVDVQRKEIQRQTDELNRRNVMNELKQKKESHKVKKRNERSQLNHDNTFLKNLPRTKLHQIICLEEKMMRDGKLRTIEDLEKFWSDIGNPESFRLMFGDEEVLTTAGYGTHMGSQENVYTELSLCNSLTSSLTSLNQEDRPIDAFTHGLSQIYEDSEPSRPGTKTGGSQSWAVTQQRKKMDKATSRNSHKAAQPSIREQETNPTLQLAKVEFPQLSCFTLDLEPPKEDPEMVMMREVYRQKARVRDYERRRVQKMYETSLTHHAATQRILGKNTEFLDVLRGPSLADVVNTGMTAYSSDCNSDDFADDLGLGQRLLALTMSGENPGMSKKYRQVEDNEKEMNSEGGSTRQSSASSRGSRSRLRHAPSPHPPVAKYARPEKPPALMLDSILPECQVMEAKQLSSLWINYGKFLPSLE